jgi:hypothetical protein
MREPSKNDYSVMVAGVGNFIFARRTLGDEISIQVERSKILDGTEHPTDFLWNLAVWMSALRVLMVKAPADWDLESLDPLEAETFDQISRVFLEMRNKEDSFRRKPDKAGEVERAENIEVDGVLVPEKV